MLASGACGIGRDSVDSLRPLIDEGLRITDSALSESLGRRRRLERELEEFLRGYDGIVTPPATDEAPADLSQTGNPTFCTIWTLCGVPAITLPLLQGPTGLPLGVQLVGRRHDDARLRQWREPDVDVAVLRHVSGRLAVRPMTGDWHVARGANRDRAGITRGARGLLAGIGERHIEARVDHEPVEWTVVVHVIVGDARHLVEVARLEAVLKEVKDYEAKKARVQRKVDLINQLKQNQRGPVRLTIEVTGPIAGGSRRTQLIHLYRELPVDLVDDFVDHRFKESIVVSASGRLRRIIQAGKPFIFAIPIRKHRDLFK